MELLFKVGTHSLQRYHVRRLRKPPKPGDMFEIVDKTVHGSKPFRVLLHEIKHLDDITDVYFVELF